MTELALQQYLDFAYIIAVVLFILSLKFLSSPVTARWGVLAGEVGAALAVVATLFNPEVAQYKWVLIPLIIGAGVGVPLGLVHMTAVPQRTALSHAFGALSAAMIGIAEFYAGTTPVSRFEMGEISLEVIIGSLTFTGSLIAAGKLQEILPQRPIVYRGQNIVSLSVLAASLGLAAALVVNPSHAILFPIMVVVALIFGVLLVTPIGGADMPTVISLLNSYAGISAALLGFVLNSKVLVVAGALDGSSGFILSVIMCKAMNRSFTNVMFGAFGQVQASSTAAKEERVVRSAAPEDAASILAAASQVVIVPGYGMAVAQAQHKVRELYDLLTRKGVDVRFAIHPVAGRMPGHMNVLLAEADIPYDRLIEMDEINGDFPQTDVALVIGANDVTNPAARTDQGSPIYGMPVLDVDKARTVMVIKRSMSPGFAGIDNPLYYLDNTLMLFGDAKAFVSNIVKELSGGSDTETAENRTRDAQSTDMLRALLRFDVPAGNLQVLSAILEATRKVAIMTPNTAEPKSIKVHQTAGTGMDIEWEDGHRSTYSFVFLRDACPCALCNEEREKDGRQPGDPLKPVAGALPMFKALAKPTKVEPVGKYAIRFVWNDGHEHGIYSWEYLREQCPCSECKARRAMEAPAAAAKPN